MDPSFGGLKFHLVKLSPQFGLNLGLNFVFPDLVPSEYSHHYLPGWGEGRASIPKFSTFDSNQEERKTILHTNFHGQDSEDNWILTAEYNMQHSKMQIYNYSETRIAVI